MKEEIELMMEPTNELSRIFFTDEYAIKYLIVTDRVASRIKCNLCDGTMQLYIKRTRLNSRIYQCVNLLCKHSSSIFKNLPISTPKIPINKYLYAIYKWVENCTEKDVLRNCDFSKSAYQTIKGHIRDYTRYMRDGMLVEKLGGENMQVQVDETAISHGQLFHNPSNMEDEAKGVVWLVGVIEENSRKFYYEILPNRKKETMRDFLSKFVKEKTKVITDGYPSYPYAVKSINGEHVIVNHSVGFKNADGFTTNYIENLWSLIKYELKKRRGVKFCNVDVFLNEFWLRYNFLKKQDSDEINTIFNEIVDFLFVENTKN